MSIGWKTVLEFAIGGLIVMAIAPYFKTMLHQTFDWEDVS